MKTKSKQILLILLALLLFFGCNTNNNDDIPSKNTEHILTLPSMKDHFADKFLIGNIMNPGDISGGNISNQNLTHHFNILTCENNMKPSYLAPSTKGGSYNFTTADNMVNAAIASNMKVVGHTLLWHSQNADWMHSVTSSTALNEMRTYITDVVGHFKGRIHSWDVLNEVFPDGVSASANWRNSMRKGGKNTGNPWYVALGADFVYEGFLAARLADPNAILYYNDYNTDQTGKATMIRNMVKDVNEQYLKSTDKPSGEDSNRLLIEGIGMQEHHNTGVSASSIRNTLNMFRNMTFQGSTKKIIVSVSELDVISQNWQDYDSKKRVTNAGRSRQAELYGEYMKVYLDYSDIIERVSLWGVTDDRSWRAAGEPLLFDKDGMAKPSYFKFVDALK